LQQDLPVLGPCAIEIAERVIDVLADSRGVLERNIFDGFCGGYSDGFCGDFYSGFDGSYRKEWR
jgi:hypothetical protein